MLTKQQALVYIDAIKIETSKLAQSGNARPRLVSLWCEMLQEFIQANNYDNTTTPQIEKPIPHELSSYEQHQINFYKLLACNEHVKIERSCDYCWNKVMKIIEKHRVSNDMQLNFKTT